MAELPGGTVTFLFSDIESSTRLLRELGERWDEALATHNRILRAAFAEEEGREVDRQGDAFFAVFPTARKALAAAAAAQRGLFSEKWPDGAEVRVRMGIHTGEPAIGGEGYLGLDVVRAARICSAANGGQVLVSETTRALVGGDRLQDRGLHRLKDMDHEERLFELLIPEVPQSRAAPRALVRPEAAAPGEIAQRLEQLGPAIERRVQDALTRANVPVAPAVVVPGLDVLDRESRRLQRRGLELKHAFALAGFVVLVVLAALVAIVYLIIQAL